ncbi:hypothetical protein L1887_62978 [Cichorium endivia]|nr:hypothetical protein L1887_62978 [Cichorium endivia]
MRKALLSPNAALCVRSRLQRAHIHASVGLGEHESQRGFQRRNVLFEFRPQALRGAALAFGAQVGAGALELLAKRAHGQLAIAPILLQEALIARPRHALPLASSSFLGRRHCAQIVMVVPTLACSFPLPQPLTHAENRPSPSPEPAGKKMSGDLLASRESEAEQRLWTCTTISGQHVLVSRSASRGLWLLGPYHVHPGMVRAKVPLVVLRCRADQHGHQRLLHRPLALRLSLLPSSGTPLRFALCHLGVALVGFGSAWFHATLLYSTQLLDELPMIYTSALLTYCVFETSPSHLKPRFRILLPWSLFAMVAWITAVYLRNGNPVFHQCAYAAIQILSTLRVIYLLTNTSSPLNSAAGKHLGYPWAVLLEGHGWWHILTGYGAYSLITAGSLLALCYKEDPANFELTQAAFPIVKRLKPYSPPKARRKVKQ